jgi:hypothetical protein
MAFPEKPYDPKEDLVKSMEDLGAAFRRLGVAMGEAFGMTKSAGNEERK